MDYEKRYKKALERAKEVIKNNPDFVRVTPQLMEEIFPELAESEDERIRKAIINTIEDCSPILPPEVQKRMIAWLEKQAPKLKWIKEDDNKVDDIVYFLNTAKTHYASTEAIDDCVEWLSSLKQRLGGEE